MTKEKDSPLHLVVRHTGQCETVRCPQAQVATRLLGGGPVTFVGCVSEVDAVLVARREDETLPVNEALRGSSYLFREDENNDDEEDTPCVRGDVVVAATDEDGEETDLDVDRALALLRLRVVF